MKQSEQMELELVSDRIEHGATRESSRRAGWWFGQMRRVADRAFELEFQGAGAAANGPEAGGMIVTCT